MYGYTYLFYGDSENTKYQLYRIINEKRHITAVLINLSCQQELADYLTNNFNAEILPASKLKILYAVYFDNKADVEKAVDFMTSFDVMKQLNK